MLGNGIFLLNHYVMYWVLRYVHFTLSLFQYLPDLIEVSHVFTLSIIMNISFRNNQKLSESSSSRRGLTLSSFTGCSGPHGTPASHGGIFFSVCFSMWFFQDSPNPASGTRAFIECRPWPQPLPKVSSSPTFSQGAQ